MDDAPRIQVHHLRVHEMIYGALNLSADKAKDYLLKEKAHLVKDEYGWSLLHHVARSVNRSQLIAPLLQIGAPLDDYDSLGESSFQRAMLSENIDFLHHYITALEACKDEGFHGATRRICNFDGKEASPLNYAIRFSTHQVCQLLIEKGADIQERDDYFLMPLLNSVCAKKASVCRLLLNAGCDTESTDSAGATALHLSTFHHDFDAAVALLLHGIDTESKNNFGQTAREMALGFKNHAWVNSFDAWQASKEAKASIEAMMRTEITQPQIQGAHP